MSLPRIARGLPLALILAALTPLVLLADDWPQFRGPNASGVSSNPLPLPTTFSPDENWLWDTPLGDGIGSPIVSQGRVFVTTMEGDNALAVVALTLADGKELWRTRLDLQPLPRITPPNSHASSTPATDGERVYLHVTTVGLVALDAKTGERLWTFTTPRPAYLMDWGAASSPIVHQGTVFFNQDDDLAPTLFAVDARTGELRWRTDRPEMLAGYAVPVLCESDGRTDLVVAGSGKLKGYDLATGSERWSCDSLPRTVMTSPVVRDGVIYISIQSYGDETRTLKYALLEWLDTNQDGVLEQQEVPKEFWERFNASDRDQDRVLKGEELDTAFQASTNLVGGGTTIQAVRGGGTGDVTKTHLLWNLHNKAPSNLTSPVVVGDQLYIVKKGGIASAFATGDGATRWELSRIRNLGDYYSSPVAGDGKIYITGENGFVVVLAQGPKLEILAKNDLGEPCLATPAIADGRILFRCRKKLVCVGMH